MKLPQAAQQAAGGRGACCEPPWGRVVNPRLTIRTLWGVTIGKNQRKKNSHETVDARAYGVLTPLAAVSSSSAIITMIPDLLHMDLPGSCIGQSPSLSRVSPRLAMKNFEGFSGVSLDENSSHCAGRYLVSNLGLPSINDSTLLATDQRHTLLIRIY